MLEAYLARIGYEGAARPDLETLTAIHRAHLLAITYENLDIHRGLAVTVREEDMLRKLIDERRGGWCYEMNGTLAWALRQIGFDVTLLASTVNRTLNSKQMEGDHLILLVHLEGRPYLADVGFGNGFLEPIPLREGVVHQGFLSYRLSAADGRWWFENHRYGGAGYDFTLEARRLEDFEEQSRYLQTSPESGFVRTTVCHRHTPEGIVTLRGVSLRRVTAAGLEESTVEDRETYRSLMEETFNLHLPDVDRLWELSWERYLAWQAQQGV